MFFIYATYKQHLHHVLQLGFACGLTVRSRYVKIASVGNATRISAIYRSQGGSSISCSCGPISVKMIERICQWEPVKLANLLILQGNKAKKAPSDQTRGNWGYKQLYRLRDNTPGLIMLYLGLQPFQG